MTLLPLLTTTAAIATCAVGGSFFAFSTIVMPALRSLPSGTAISAMQAINVSAVTPVFMTALFGTGVGCIALGIRGLTTLPEDGSIALVIGAALYSVVTIGVTIAANVPLNTALERVSGNAPDAAARFVGFSRPWTGWNHLRSLGALAAGVAFAFSVVQQVRGA